MQFSKIGISYPLSSSVLIHEIGIGPHLTDEDTEV